MGVTSPDNIYVHDGNLPASMVAISQAEGASVQAALNKRERYDFVWADSAERTAQTGMVQGSRGYQIDTKSEYLYDNSAWRLALSHAEFTASKSVANNTYDQVGVFSLDATQSTNTTFVTPGASGILIIVDPGMYAVSATIGLSVATTARTIADLSTSAIGGVGLFQRVSVQAGEAAMSLAMPNLRFTAANTSIYMNILQQSGGASTVQTRARITRLG